LKGIAVLLATIPLKKDMLTDGGFRLRKNTLHAIDNIFGFSGKFLRFLDYDFYNLDTFSKSAYDYSNPKYEPYKYRIAELFFRNCD
jgi:hypothetical protein